MPTKTTLDFSVTAHNEEPVRHAQADITVYCEYDTETEEATDIKVQCYDYFKGHMTDLTDVFKQNPILSQFIESINWPEVYAEKESIPEEN